MFTLTPVLFSEAGQLRVLIVDAASKAKGLEGVAGYCAAAIHESWRQLSSSPSPEFLRYRAEECHPENNSA